MKLVIARFAAAALVTAAAALPAAAYANTARPAAHRCVQSFDGSVDQGVSPNYGEVRWLSTGCGYYIRGRSLCASRFGGSQYVYGGWVQANRLWSRATCTSSRPVIQQLKAQLKHTVGGAISTCEIWPNYTC
jgi:uncharacterized protein YraI